MFMFVEVPEPVWKTSIGNWSAWRPEATSRRRLADRLRDGGVDRAEFRIHLGTGALDDRERLEDRALDGSPRDREILDGALRLRPPAGIGGHTHLAHRIVLDPEPVRRGGLGLAHVVILSAAGRAPTRPRPCG